MTSNLNSEPVGSGCVGVGFFGGISGVAMFGNLFVIGVFSAGDEAGLFGWLITIGTHGGNGGSLEHVEVKQSLGRQLTCPHWAMHVEKTSRQKSGIN